MFLNKVMPQDGTFTLIETGLEFENKSTEDIAVVSVAYSYFRSGNYILISPTVYEKPPRI